ncbi:MAG: hypothetical protein R3Y63_06605 [Eubacteriales bacterium]
MMDSTGQVNEISSITDQGHPTIQVQILEVNMEKKKHLGLHIDSELHYKLHYICKYEGRSANAQVLYLIRKCILEFEKEQGTIVKADKLDSNNEEN